MIGRLAVYDHADVPQYQDEDLAGTKATELDHLNLVADVCLRLTMCASRSHAAGPVRKSVPRTVVRPGVVPGKAVVIRAIACMLWRYFPHACKDTWLPI